MREQEMREKEDETQVDIKNEENEENFQHLQCGKHDCMVGQMNDVHKVKHDDQPELCLPQGKEEIEVNPTRDEPPLNFGNDENTIQKEELEEVIRNSNILDDNPRGLDLSNAHHELFPWRLKCGQCGHLTIK